MNWSRFGSYLVTLCLVSLAATSLDVQAVSTVKKKEQKFTLAPKKKSFIDFAKIKDPSKSDPIKFKAKKNANGKKKPAAKFKFGAPVPAATGGTGHTVSVELVSLSLVSTSPVFLDPIFGQGSGKGDLVLSLLAPKFKSKAPAKLDPDAAKKKRKGKKGKGKLDIKLDKKIKVTAKKNSGKKSKMLTDKKPANKPDKKLKALALDFAFASPITITDPSFCLESGDSASICLAPIVNPVPLPGTLALMAPALAILFTGHIVRRRRLKGGSSRLAA